MKYISIDIETSGLDPEKNKILSFAAIMEDTSNPLPIEDLPKFKAIILQREIVGSPRALTMNSHLIESIGNYLDGDESLKKEIELSTGYKFLEKEKVVEEFFGFLVSHPPICEEWEGDWKKRDVSIDTNSRPVTINVAGKNFATFDKLFLEQLPLWKRLIRVRQRIIDPSVLFCDWTKDKTLPSLQECKNRAELNSVVSHDATDDAIDVIMLLRKFYQKNEVSR